MTQTSNRIRNSLPLPLLEFGLLTIFTCYLDIELNKSQSLRAIRNIIMADVVGEGGREVENRGGGGGGSSVRSLPEVELKWSDFVWSLEKLRHKSYCKSMRERYSASYLIVLSLSCSLYKAKTKTKKNTERKWGEWKKIVQEKKCRNPGLITLSQLSYFGEYVRQCTKHQIVPVHSHIFCGVS